MKPESCAEVLARVLVEHGISQTHLARVISRTPQYVNDILRNKKHFDLPVMLELEAVLGSPTLEEWQAIQAKHARAELETEIRARVERGRSAADLIKQAAEKAEAERRVAKQLRSEIVALGGGGLRKKLPVKTLESIRDALRAQER